MPMKRLSAPLLLLTACNNAPSTAPGAEPAPLQANEPVTEPTQTQQAPKPAAYGFDPAPVATGSAALEAPEATSKAAAGERSARPGATAPAADVEGAQPAEVRRGPAVKGEGFQAHLQSSGSYQVGKPGVVRVVLNAAEPFHCNDKYPYRFTLEPTAGLEFPADVVRDMQIGTQQSTMDVALVPKTAGAHTVSGELSFSVCTDDKCLIEKQKLSVSIDVAGAS